MSSHIVCDHKSTRDQKKGGDHVRQISISAWRIEPLDNMRVMATGPDDVGTLKTCSTESNVPKQW